MAFDLERVIDDVENVSRHRKEGEAGVVEAGLVWFEQHVPIETDVDRVEPERTIFDVTPGHVHIHDLVFFKLTRFDGLA